MKNVQLIKSQLKRKLDEGTLTQDDVATARECAVSIGTIESQVLYAQIKRALEAQQEG